MLEAFDKVRSEKLRGFIVWLPMVTGDSVASAQAHRATDSRILEAWDGARLIGDIFAETLALKKTAWDVYLVYEPGTKWISKQPPSPSFWMHQLNGAPPDLRLVAASFHQALEKSATGTK